MTKRVLLTGASGFVGSHMLHALLEHTDYEVVLVSSFTCNGTLDRIVNVVERSTNQNVTIVRHDLTAPLTSARELNRIGVIDYVLDVASRCSVDESFDEPSCFIQHNVAVTLNTLDLATELEPTAYVHLSTDEVYGPYAPRSDTDHRPSSPYAASKAAQESICHAYNRSYDIPMTIVNPSNMFGERQSTLAFVPRIVRAIRKQRVLPIHLDANGEPGRRHYTYAGDVATWVIGWLVENEGDLPPRMPLPGLHEANNLELAMMVAEIMDRKLTIEERYASEVRPGYDDRYQPLQPVDGWLDVEDHRTDENRDNLFADRLRRTVTWFNDHPEWLE